MEEGIKAAETAYYAIRFSGNSQAEHRINLLRAWYPVIKEGTRVLEIGCGQGTCTEVLAAAVGDKGHVDAVDPGNPDYGAPMTLAQAQEELSSGPFGSRITWHRADPVDFCSSPAYSETTRWDVAVLAHCIWYFKSADALTRILSALKGRVGAVCIAEYALRASHMAAVPHVLAAIARATLETLKGPDESEENIQIPLSPMAIKETARDTGWVLKTESIVIPAEGLDDGRWETKTVISEGFMQDMKTYISSERSRAICSSARDAVEIAVEGLGGLQAVRTMDVWVVTLIGNGRGSEY